MCAQDRHEFDDHWTTHATAAPHNYKAHKHSTDQPFCENDSELCLHYLGSGGCCDGDSDDDDDDDAVDELSACLHTALRSL